MKPKGIETMIFVGQKIDIGDQRHFDHLLDKTTSFLENDYKENKSLNWNQFEKDTEKALKFIQQANPSEKFSKWIVELHSGSKFPDIVIDINKNMKFGIEVKTSQSNGWKTLGGSIMESTRIKDVERIKILFAKNNPFKVRHANFEDCISDVAVTHSPRYVIDLDIDKEQSIFKKINAKYDEIWKSDNPYSFFKPYFQAKAKKEKTGLWFVDEDDNKDPEDLPKLQVLFYNELPEYKKLLIRNKAMLLFPEIFRNRADYKSISLWLLQMGVLNYSLRDMFSAGENQILNGVNIPSKFKRLIDSKEEMVAILSNNNFKKDFTIQHEKSNFEEAIIYWKNIVVSSAQNDDQKEMIKKNIEEIINDM